ncbi:MAG: hypothetical protein CMD27_03345 [Flavobacteriales bacterium]|jgi:23S rRNA (pseudouridine1915-N3)-methyltransferase|nr:hypothetical protein [Flavobacteriales bacterium]|tara:strand:+ start:1643 stop:2083 length:441 start_codon:yes stop_codon:yes gene_type:complete
MKLSFIFLGKKKLESYDLLMSKYFKRLNSFINSDVLFINEKNNLKLEKKISTLLKSRDLLVVLDEKGIHMSSDKYAFFLNEKLKQFNTIFFLVGASYGVPLNIIKQANFTISLSKMTLPHLIARLVLVEQTYRALTILNNHPYHHE